MHCKQLSNISKINDAIELEDWNEIIDAIKVSALQWLSLGVVNNDAAKALEGVKRRVNYGIGKFTVELTSCRKDTVTFK